ncbi:hypothetical protein DsansV1_C37g0232841 [Dioscorea sansibarensis]
MLDLEDENEVLKRQWESSFERFPSQLDQVNTTVMRMVFIHKENFLENLVKALDMISSGLEFRLHGMSFVIEHFKSAKHSSLYCTCDKGFSITRSTINLSE